VEKCERHGYVTDALSAFAFSFEGFSLTAIDAAIWDNRSAFHIGLLDYEGLGERFGYRVVSIGEKPYLDSNSTSRKVALGLDNANWRLD
jgi:hypothetical protein